MNINDYRRAMDRVVPDPQLKERIMNQKNTKKKYTPARRVFTVALAAVLTVACLFTVAFAASPDFRTAVLSFFRMEEREQVPSSNAGPDGPDVSNTEIGELVKAQYIKMDKHYGMSAGLLNDLTWSEDRKTLLDYKFWEVKNNELIPVEVDMKAGQMDITYDGIRYQGTFWWFIHEGTLDYFTADTDGYNEETGQEWHWYFSPISGRTDALLLHLSRGRQIEYTEHHFLYHLDTGEAEDLLAKADLAALEQPDGAIWSEDFRLGLITGQANEQFPYGREWLYDRKTGTLTDVRDLGGVGADSAMFADENTLILYDSTGSIYGGVEYVTVYAYDLTTGQAVRTLEQTPRYRSLAEDPWGVEISGSHCVFFSEDGQARVVDLKTGAQTLLEGFVCHPEDKLRFNPSGTKLLYFAMDPEVEGLGISQIGVADLEKGVFFAFDREGYENLYEGGIGWSDDNTVSINASTLDGETQYLLLYQF